MKRLSTILVLPCLAGVMLPGISSAEGQTLIYGNTSGWTIHTEPAHGYRCFAEALYEGDTSIRFGFDPADGSVWLRLADDSWVAGAEGEADDALELRFDDGEPLRFEAPTADLYSITVHVPESERQSFTRSFTAGYMLTAAYGSHEPIMLSLGGSSRATRLLEECEAAMSSLNTSAPRQ